LILCLTLTCAHAEKYALLIGIGRYAPATGVENLEGPVNDATALRQALTATWQFKPENIKTLFDANATRSQILGALDGYVSTLKQGDFLFLFYSGHGTSWFAQGMPQTGITADTGAIVSSDLKLIVGNLDLQPRLRKLDGVAEVFAVFDSCYSGNSIKSFTIAPAKYLPANLFRTLPKANLSQYDKQFSDFDKFTASTDAYPYRRVLYLSAASKAEQAVDIPKQLISQGFHTVDGLPHGALTDALLRGLKGEADTNHDSKITYEELYQFARSHVSRQFPQTPQFLFPPSEPRIQEAAIFSMASAMVPAPPAARATGPTALRVKLEGSAGALRARVSAIPGVAIAHDLFDLLVRAEDGGFALYHQSGSLIQKYRPEEEANLLSRIRAEPEVRKLIDLSYSRQTFNVVLTIDPVGRGFYNLGDRLKFRAKAQQDCYLLLLDIDVSGAVVVLSPLNKQQSVKAAAGTEAALGRESKVTQPTGMEYLKLFAFSEKPAGLDELVSEAREAFAPGTPIFERLMKLVEPDLVGRASTQVKLVTSE
jgi:hypothetical protein